jgi:methylmalonic aciduria homocystinuria type C protein
MSDWRTLCAQVGAACAEAGLDLVHPLRIDEYNAAAPLGFAMPDYGRRGALGVIVGNTRALWPRVLEALAADPELAADADPIDRYAEAAMRAALAPIGARWTLWLAPDPPPRRPAMQLMAHVAGLAYRSESRLSVHPVYGPWIALRGAAVIDVDGPREDTALSAPCTCAGHCAIPLARIANAEGARPPRRADIVADWRAWLAVRDACPVGRAHRYDEAQLEYHYTGDREVLARAVRDRERGSTGPR